MTKTCHAITTTVCLFVLAAAFTSTGCQGIGNPLKGKWGQQSRSSSGFPGLSVAQGKPKKMTEEQKTAIQVSTARSLEKRGQTDRAVKAYRNIVSRDTHCALAYHRLAVLHDKKGDCEASEEYYRKALEIDPDNAEVHCDLGYSYYLQQRWAEAERSLSRAIEIDSSHSRSHNNLGLLLARTDRKYDSLHAFRRAGCSDTEAYANLDFAVTQDQQLAAIREPVGIRMTQRSAPTQSSVSPMRRLPHIAFDSVENTANRPTQRDYSSEKTTVKRIAPPPKATLASASSAKSVAGQSRRASSTEAVAVALTTQRKVTQAAFVVPEPPAEVEISDAR